MSYIRFLYGNPNIVIICLSVICMYVCIKLNYIFNFFLFSEGQKDRQDSSGQCFLQADLSYLENPDAKGFLQRGKCLN